MAPKCKICVKTVYPMDPQINLDGNIFHKPCAKCADCNCQITISNFSKHETEEGVILLCKTHYFKRFREEGAYLGGEKYHVKATRDVQASARRASTGTDSRRPSLAPPSDNLPVTSTTVEPTVAIPKLRHVDIKEDHSRRSSAPVIVSSNLKHVELKADSSDRQESSIEQIVIRKSPFKSVEEVSPVPETDKQEVPPPAPVSVPVHVAVPVTPEKSVEMEQTAVEPPAVDPQSVEESSSPIVPDEKPAEEEKEVAVAPIESVASDAQPTEESSSEAATEAVLPPVAAPIDPQPVDESSFPIESTVEEDSSVEEVVIATDALTVEEPAHSEAPEEPTTEVVVSNGVAFSEPNGESHVVVKSVDEEKKEEVAPITNEPEYY
eukprot:gene1516-1651_t